MSLSTKQSLEDDNEYWNGSKCKGFDFDDDMGQLSESKKTVRSMKSFSALDNDDEDDSFESISWSEATVKEARPVRPPLTLEGSAGAPSGRGSGVLGSAQRFLGGMRDSRPSRPALSSSMRSLSSGHSLTSLGMPAKVPSFGQDTSAGGHFGSSLSISEVVESALPRPSSDNQRLRRLQQPYSLEQYRSLKEKLELLDRAVQFHDGNVITAILIFLKSTLRKEVLFGELITRTVAANHLVHLLKRSRDWKMLVELLTSMGKADEAALMEYKTHQTMRDPDKRVAFLKRCFSLPFSMEDSGHIRDQYTLLERQIIIEANDKKVEAAGTLEIFKKYPRKASILFMPLVTTFYYCCFYHYAEQEGSLSCPLNLRKNFSITDKQFLWTALAARSKLKEWTDVDSLLTTKRWFGTLKKTAPIGFHRVVDIVSKNNAPPNVLHEYIMLVADEELKLNLAIKHKCHAIVVDMLCQMRDRQQLLQYKKEVEPGSQVEQRIVEVLHNPQIKWKN
ncbi:spermatogenesis-defective protein 39 homolog isoform X2 [Petromyzon marinus]|uniref:Spermatogenesis-defective protein 39 homolog n=1 Tax=Petromyzon marinus TaxID=7757 RepID=A0AAJ7TNB0_PETMA|nr:spermatogenesis-defective protein 39 homolog isoform X2 [Petromyzon marinus]